MLAALIEAEVAALLVAACLLPAHALRLSRRKQLLVTRAHTRLRHAGRVAAIRPATRTRVAQIARRLTAAEFAEARP